MKRIRRTAALACAVLSATAALGLANATATESPDPAFAAAGDPVAVGAVTWKACEDSDFTAVGVECGDLAVPLDYADPTGRQITVAVSRLKATGPLESRRGPLLVNFGGPGGTGLDAPLFFREVLPADVLASYDVVGFDPRGLGASKPALDCGYNPWGPGRQPDYRPSTGLLEAPGPNEELWRARWRAFTSACAAEHSDLLPYLASTHVIRDMDAIRAALGAEKLNLYGFSYGTYLGELYSTTFPARTGRFVLDGNIDPTTVWYPDLFVSARATEEAAHSLWSWIARYDSVYHLGSSADEVEAAYYREEEDLRKNPLERVGPAEWTDLVWGSTYSQDAWPFVASVFAAQARGDSAPLEQVFAPVEDQTAAEAAADEHAAANAVAVFASVFCTDGPWPRNYSQWRADIFASDALAPFNSWPQALNDLGCGSWPVEGERASVNGAAAPPLLLTSTLIDPATPFLNSLNVRLAFPGAALLADTGSVGHTATLQGNECVDEVVFDYLRTGALPARADGRLADKLCDGRPVPEPLAEDLARTSGETTASARDMSELRAMLGIERPRPPKPSAPVGRVPSATASAAAAAVSASTPSAASVDTPAPVDAPTPAASEAERRAAARAALHAAIAASHRPGR